MKYTALQMYVFILGFVSLVSIIVPLVAFAHGDGASFERQVGDYIVDVGYEPENPQVGERLLLDLNILNADESPQDFTSVWVRLEEGGGSVLATGVAKSAVGPTTLLMKMPSAGEFTLYARFELSGTVLAEASFSLSVGEGEQSSSGNSDNWLLSALAGLIVGAAGVYLLKKH